MFLYVLYISSFMRFTRSDFRSSLCAHLCMDMILCCQNVGTLNEFLTLAFRYSGSHHSGWQNDCGKLINLFLDKGIAGNF